jgi:hypothetical protein
MHSRFHLNLRPIIIILWHRDPLLDNTRNTRGQQSRNGVFYVGGRKGCCYATCAVTSQNNMRPSRDIFWARGGDVTQQWWVTYKIIKSVPDFVKIDQLVQKLKWGTRTHTHAPTGWHSYKPTSFSHERKLCISKKAKYGVSPREARVHVQLDQQGLSEEENVHTKKKLCDFSPPANYTDHTTVCHVVTATNPHGR